MPALTNINKKTINLPFCLDNPRIAYDFRVNGEFPGYIADGMTIDRDGLLWVALFKGDQIVVIDPK